MKGIVITALIGFVLLAGSNVVNYLYHQGIIEEYKVEIDEIVWAMDQQQEVQIRGLTTAFTVGERVRVNTPVRRAQLVTIEIPTASVTQNTILNQNDFTRMWWRLDLEPGTIITRDLIMRDYRDDTSRWMEITLDYFTPGTVAGDYIDIRVILPGGHDFIVLPKRRIYRMFGNTITLLVTEQEIHFLHGFMLDQFMYSGEGFISYGMRYIDPGLQAAATAYYTIPLHIIQFMESVPSIRDTVFPNIDMAQAQISRDAIVGLIDNMPDHIASRLISGRAQWVANIMDMQSDFFQAITAQDGNPQPGPMFPQYQVDEGYWQHENRRPGE
jgi:hypothetical protein